MNEVLSDKIKNAVTNPDMIAPLDETKVACIFYGMLKESGEIDLSDVDMTIQNLPSSFSKYTKDTIYDIASVIEMLALCSEEATQ